MQPDRKTRAEAAINLLRNCVTNEDQNGYDLLISIVDRERLFDTFSGEDGKPFASIEQFTACLESEDATDNTAGTVTASAVAQPRRLTGDERYAARLARRGS